MIREPEYIITGRYSADQFSTKERGRNHNLLSKREIQEGTQRELWNLEGVIRKNFVT